MGKRVRCHFYTIIKRHIKVPLFRALCLWCPTVQGTLSLVSHCSGHFVSGVPLFRALCLWCPTVQGTLSLVSHCSGHFVSGVPLFRALCLLCDMRITTVNVPLCRRPVCSTHGIYRHRQQRARDAATVAGREELLRRQNPLYIRPRQEETLPISMQGTAQESA